jgi:TatA/E family protein of Tat protein translocase
MLNLDPGKLLVIGIVAVMVLGPDKLPQVARQVGGAWRSFNEFRHRMETEVRSSIPDLPSTEEIAHLAKSPAAFLHRLSTLSDPDEAEPVRTDLADVWDSVGQDFEREHGSSDSEPSSAVENAARSPRQRDPVPAPMVLSGDAGLN